MKAELQMEQENGRSSECEKVWRCKCALRTKLLSHPGSVQMKGLSPEVDSGNTIKTNDKMYLFKYACKN